MVLKMYLLSIMAILGIQPLVFGGVKHVSLLRHLSRGTNFGACPAVGLHSVGSCCCHNKRLYSPENNVTKEDPPFEDVFPIETRDFPMSC